MNKITTSSISEIAIQTFLRFPLLLLISTMGSISLILFEGYDIYGDQKDSIIYLYKLSWSCLLGVPLLFLIHIFSREIRNPFYEIFLHLLGGLSIVITYFILPDSIANWDHFFHFKIIVVIILFAVSCSFLPFLNKYDELVFWTHNKNLLIAIVFAFIYSSFLFVSVYLVNYSFELLFNLSIPDVRIKQICIGIYGILGTWYFLSMYPQDYETPKDYNIPVGLNRFLQFVLIPLVFIFGVFLYLISLKTIISWQLPKTTLSPLVIGFGLLGLLAYFYSSPLPRIRVAKWVEFYHRSFFVAILPLMALLFTLLAKRIVDYGYTELRYFGVLFGIWFFLLSVYYLLYSRKKLIYIPLSFFLIVSFGVFFPYLNAFSVTKRDQIYRLKTILEEENLIDKLNNSKQVYLAKEKSREIKNIIYFLEDRQSLDELRPFFGSHFDTLENNSLLNAFQLNNIFVDSSYLDKPLLSIKGKLNYINIGYYESLYVFNEEEQNKNLKEVYFKRGKSNMLLNLESFSDSIIQLYLVKKIEKHDSLVFHYLDEIQDIRMYFEEIKFSFNRAVKLESCKGIFLYRSNINTDSTVVN